MENVLKPIIHLNVIVLILYLISQLVQKVFLK